MQLFNLCLISELDFVLRDSGMLSEMTNRCACQLPYILYSLAWLFLFTAIYLVVCDSAVYKESSCFAELRLAAGRS